MIIIYQRATIKDVAARAGVSTATVSNVINNNNNVKEHTKEIVLKAIKELNYHPDRVAQSFKTGKKQVIGLIVPDISNSFFVSLIENIEAVLQEKNYQVLIANTHENINNEIESIRMFTSGLVDGLIVASSTTEYKELETILPKNSKIPIVFLERSVNDCPFDSVMISDYDAVRQSVEYLISKGHKKIGFIYGITTISPAIERLRAYKDALEKNGIEFNKKYIKDVPNHSFEAVDSLVKNGCSAIIAATNKVTIDTILYFLNNDISIKNQIQLTGFLNDDYSSINLTNMLLILHPIKELANHSVRLLFNRMENPDSSIKNTILLSRFAKPQN